MLTGGQTQAQVDAVWAQYGNAYTYDAASRRLTGTDPLGNRTVFFYDADGALTHTVNALGEVQESRYDARGRVIEAIAYANRISTAGLAGGLATATLAASIAAVAERCVGQPCDHDVHARKPGGEQNGRSGTSPVPRTTRSARKSGDCWQAPP